MSKRMDHVKIGIGVSSIGRFLPLIGRAEGLFEKQNIAAEIVNQQDEEKVVEDIAAQNTPIGTPNAPSLIFSRLAGSDLVIVGGILNRPAFYLAAKPEIAALPELKGKRIGINQPRRMAGMVMLALLRRWGIEKDLTLVDLGLNDKSLEALSERNRRRSFAAGKGVSRPGGRISPRGRQSRPRVPLGAAGDDAAISPLQPRAGPKNCFHI